jgi:hypothetical protein
MPTIRAGKTAKDRKSGATERRFMNRAARVEWEQDVRATNATFPKHDCNGKKNRSRWTGKGNKTIIK